MPVKRDSQVSPGSGPLPVLKLKRREERRIRFGHPWIFSNEVDVEATPLKDFEPGEFATVVTTSGKPLGSAYVNPHSLICARIVSSRADSPLDARGLAQRLEHADSLRRRLFDAPFYRMAYGESDGLPGLVIDRYDTVFVVQVSTAGMDRQSSDLIEILVHRFGATSVIWRNDVASRALEGLESGVAVAYGDPPQKISLREHGASFEVEPMSGQKTGWFFDQRANRGRFLDYVRGQSVLDCFCYTGAWGVQAALSGASRVLCVDSSKPAVAQVEHHTRLNGVDGVVQTRCGDAFDTLRELATGAESFGVVILDPPAFIRRKKDYASGLQAYRRLHRKAFELLVEDGIVVSSSCSYHLPRDTHIHLMHDMAKTAGRRLQILEHGGQGPDHPIHPALGESEYLKCVVARVSRG